MIEAVFVFGAMNMVFEFVLLCLLPPRARLRVLGSPTMRGVLHFCMLLANLAIHWGTLVGSMASILAFCTSLITVHLAAITFGSITNRIYRPGLVHYHVKELQ